MHKEIALFKQFTYILNINSEWHRKRKEQGRNQQHQPVHQFKERENSADMITAL